MWYQLRMRGCSVLLLLIPGVAHAQAATRAQGVTTRVSAPLPTAASSSTHVISHAPERTAGWWILGVTGGVGVTSTTLGMLKTCGSDQSCQEWTSLAIWSGIAVTTAGALLALPKIATSDEVMLTLVPGTAPPPDTGRFDRLGTEQASRILGGATLVGRF